MSRMFIALGLVSALASVAVQGCSENSDGGTASGGGNGDTGGSSGKGGAESGGSGGSNTGGTTTGQGGTVGAGGSGGTVSSGGSGGSATGGSATGGSGGSGGTKPTLGFFITSANPGMGGDLKGLDGADAHCKTLATAVGAGARTWRAYLSSETIDARTRIGTGPWSNAKGVVVATSVDDLHSANNKLSKANSLNEKGEVVNGRGDTPNRHDIMTGSTLDGRKIPGQNCTNWTANTTGATTQVGHHDRDGGGTNPTSWNSAHASSGCTLVALRGSGGDGLYYCFAAD
jgi:hypothetical protein